jgi:hypothetical protein
MRCSRVEDEIFRRPASEKMKMLPGDLSAAGERFAKEQSRGHGGGADGIAEAEIFGVTIAGDRRLGVEWRPAIFAGAASQLGCLTSIACAVTDARCQASESYRLGSRRGADPGFLS